MIYVIIAELEDIKICRYVSNFYHGYHLFINKMCRYDIRFSMHCRTLHPHYFCFVT